MTTLIIHVLLLLLSALTSSVRLALLLGTAGVVAMLALVGAIQAVGAVVQHLQRTESVAYACGPRGSTV